MDLRVRGFCAFLPLLVIVIGETTTIKQDSVSDTRVSFNPNVPPGFIFDGSSGSTVSNSLNSSDVNTTSLKTLSTNTTTGVSQTTLSKTSPRTTGITSVILSTHKQSSSSQSTQKVQESTRNSPITVQTTSVGISTKLPAVTALHTSEALNSTDSENASLSTLPVTMASQQTTTVVLELTKSRDDSHFLTTLKSARITKSNMTTQKSITKQIILSNVTNTKQTFLSNVSTTLRKRPTTDPFNDNRPWNLRRSTHHPSGIGNGKRRTTTEPISANYDNGDTFWPVAMALTIGIPTIIVFAVTITVLYRRRMNKPRSLLGIYGTDYQSM